MCVLQMPGGQFGSEQTPISLVKKYQRVGYEILIQETVELQQPLTDMGDLESLAFDSQKAKFLNRVKASKLPIKLQTIDYGRGVGEKNVLRP